MTATTVQTPGPGGITTVAGGLDHPWDVAFLPDGTMLVTERSGSVDAIVGGKKRVLAGPGDILPRNEAGLMGLAVDPDFSHNRRVFACLSTRGDARVARWTLTPDGTRLVDRADILTGIPDSATGQHHGCRLRFGPDGYLWVTTGDSLSATVPQDPQSLGGKVLRITTDGAAAPGNAGAPFRPEVYTYGHRNVQGVAFRPADGQAFSLEHGTSRDDEVNLLRPGANYGWDPRHADDPTIYDDQRPMTDQARHPDALPAVWSSGSPCVAPSGGTFLSGAAWGRLDGAFAVAELRGERLQVFTSLEPGRVRSETPITDRGRLRAAVQGPDGALYLATDADDGQILRVAPGSI